MIPEVHRDDLKCVKVVRFVPKSIQRVISSRSLCPQNVLIKTLKTLLGEYISISRLFTRDGPGSHSHWAGS